jgi:eukaryotic-like serine/threonine-protein kinase
VLGRGAHGVVYEAVDLHTRELVAIKIFEPGYDPSRIRREIAALRLLRVRGVVRFIEEGTTDEGAAFIAMERIDGSDFPGAAKPVTWEALAPTALALFETLASVHSAGIVHRDLKPGNVLVDREGRPTLVDFGVSWRADVAPAHTQEGQLLGTPSYMSPEQIRSDSVGPATDLYAAGLMIYEALTGALPHLGAQMQATLWRRLREEVQPLVELAPSTPPAVARVIDQLLAIDQRDRPRSADLVVALLTEQGGVDTSVIPRLGVNDPVTDVMSALSLGLSAVVVGPRGSGRTKVLDEVIARCREEGRALVTLTRGNLPFASLRPLVESWPQRELSLFEAEQQAERALIAAISAGTLIFADDVESCDARTQRLLERVAELGGTVRSRLAVLSPVRRRAPTRPLNEPASIFLSDFEEHELQELFLGGDRVFHTRADAARILHILTGGRSARVVAELRRWERIGVVHWNGGRMSVNAALLDELDARPSAAGALLDLMVPEHLGEALEWLGLCAAGVELEVLARAMGHLRFEVEGMIDELELLGAARRQGSLIFSVGQVRNAAMWTLSKVRDAHRSLAAELPLGSPRRLLHLLAGTEPTDPVPPSAIADEAVALARGSIAEGRLSRAVTWLADSVVAIRHGDDQKALIQVVAEWVRVAVMFRTPSALDQALAELARTPAVAPVPNLQQLARTALAALTTGGTQTLEQAERIAPFEDPHLELERFDTRVHAARRTDLESEQRVVAASAQWAFDRGDREARARASSWIGRLRYRESEFSEAARLHHEAAQLTANATVRIDSLLDAASAEMENLDVAQAMRDAEVARRAAIENRNPRQEARAEWLLRTLAYRDNRTTSVDEELLELVKHVGSLDQESLLAFTEAAVAYRAGQRDRARQLAELASSGWRELGRKLPAATSRSLAIACGEPVSEALLDELIGIARTNPDPVIGIQILALVVQGYPALRPRVRALATQLAQSIAPRYLRARSDVLSPEESIASIFSTPL